MKSLFALMTVTLFMFCNPSWAQAQAHVHTVTADQGMVACESSLASRIGRDILKRGGNAVDAAVATAFGLAVTWPEAGNIGGGGFMIIEPGNGKPPVFVDYREVAPLLAKEDTYALTDSRYNRKAVGVPGTVRGLELAHKEFGKLSWHEVVLPAAKLAETGFTVSGPLAGSTNYVLSLTKGNELYSELHRVYGKPGGGNWSTGDIMELPDLAKTLYRIAENGSDGFYTGPVAELTVKEMEKGKGLIRQADLDQYEAKIRKPIVGTFERYEVIGAAPPSSGGICTVMALNMVEALDVPKDRYSPQTIHLLGEVSRRIFLDRARHLGDPDFVEIPAHLTTKEYARKLAAGINKEQASNSEALAPDIEIAPESDNTTHFSVVDKDGMAVSNTYTLEASWGSRMVVAGAGYVLNNEMGDFNWVKGLTTTTGRIGTDANLIRPAKRMLSSQNPVIVKRDGKVVLVTGSPGGRTIINTVLNVVLNHTYFGMSPSEAVQSPRFHHQWMPDMLFLEGLNEEPYSSALKPLEAMGHRVVERPAQGSAHSIFVDPSSRLMTGISDGRRDGRPAGFSNDLMACWEFGGTSGMTMEEASNEGNLNLRWSRNISGTSVDGDEHLTLRRDAPNQPADSYAPIAKSPKRMQATIKFDGIRFSGQTRNEQVRLGFTHDNRTPNVTARVILERGEDNQIYVRGEALGEGSSDVERFMIADSNQFDDPFSVRVLIDTEQDRYSISIQQPSKMEFTKVGDGSISQIRQANFLRLSTIGDTSANGEYIHIDRIELRHSK